MKKSIEIVLMTFLILLVAPGSLAQQRVDQPVEFKNITGGLFEILGGQGARGGAYIGDNAVLIIDAKMSQKSVDEVIKGIRKMTEKPIRYLVNTHSDGDHVQGNRYFPKKVIFIAHENCRDDFFRPDRRGNPSQWNKPEFLPFVPAITFRDKMDIHLGSKKVELWYFDVGHTTGDIVVYFPEERTAFLGDQIFLIRPQLIHSYKGGNSFEHVKTLNRMLDTINAETFCSGHSEITNRSGIKKHIARMKERQDKVRALLEKGKGPEEIKGEFEENEARLIETICNEIKEASG